MNLKKPKNFNQKIQWLKLNDTTELKTLLADKYLMRSWVEQYIGEKYLVPLLGVWDNFEEINFEKLPDKFVLKCLEEIVNEFESYIYSVKEIDSKEDIIAKIMAYFVILEITDNETLDNFMNKVDIPDDEEDDVLEYISEAFEICLSSLNNYKKVYKN